MAQQPNAEVAAIASTYIARLTERIYRHLRGSMERDYKTHEFVKNLMETPLKVLQMRPGFGGGSQSNLNNMTLRPIIRHDPGSAILPPGPDCSILEHIEAAYKNFEHMQYVRFLTHSTQVFKDSRRVRHWRNILEILTFADLKGGSMIVSNWSRIT